MMLFWLLKVGRIARDGRCTIERRNISCQGTERARSKTPFWYAGFLHKCEYVLFPYREVDLCPFPCRSSIYWGRGGSFPLNSLAPSKMFANSSLVLYTVVVSSSNTSDSAFAPFALFHTLPLGLFTQLPPSTQQLPCPLPPLYPPRFKTDPRYRSLLVD